MIGPQKMRKLLHKVCVTCKNLDGVSKRCRFIYIFLAENGDDEDDNLSDVTLPEMDSDFASGMNKLLYDTEKL